MNPTQTKKVTQRLYELAEKIDLAMMKRALAKCEAQLDCVLARQEARAKRLQQ